MHLHCMWISGACHIPDIWQYSAFLAGYPTLFARSALDIKECPMTGDGYPRQTSNNAKNNQRHVKIPFSHMSSWS